VGFTCQTDKRGIGNLAGINTNKSVNERTIVGGRGGESKKSLLALTQFLRKGQSPVRYALVIKKKKRRY